MCAGEWSTHMGRCSGTCFVVCCEEGRPPQMMAQAASLVTVDNRLSSSQ